MCIRSHDDFPYKLKLLEGASPLSGEKEETRRRSRTERGRMRERMREKVRDMRDRDREEGEADQRRVESREAGSVPFSRSQAAIPFGSVVAFAHQ